MRFTAISPIGRVAAGRRRPSTGSAASTEQVREVVAEAIPDRPFRVVLWDGTEVPATSPDGPVFEVRSPIAIGHLLRAPSQLGLARAYVSGSLTVDDIDKVLELVDNYELPAIDAKTKVRLAAAAVRMGALREIPRPPAVELHAHGWRHSIARDKRAVTYHYDVSNDFFALFLDKSMTYSCGVWSRGATTLEQAQETKLELVCTKLGLEEGERVLDVGCGWGSFAVHAAKRHGVRVTGITLSEPQAARARQRAEEEGVAHRVDVRVMDYRQLGGEQYDAISSIGMVEHVGAENISLYARKLASVLRPGGRLLNHGISRLRANDVEIGPFTQHYVFPDGAPLHLSRVQNALESAGFETRHVEGFRPDYARTLREWTRRLEDNSDEAVRLAGIERMRVWRIYLRGARRGFETGFTSVYQVLADRV